MKFENNHKNSIILTASNFLGVLVNGMFWFYFATTLDKDEFGELGYLLSFATVGFAFANVGLSSMIVVYGAKKENVIQPAFEISLISTSIVSVIVFLLTTDIWLFLIVWGLSIFNLMTAEQISQKSYISYSKYNLLRRFLVIIFTIALYPIFGIPGILVGFFLSNIPSFKILFRLVKLKKFSFYTLLKPKRNFMIHSYFLDLSQTLFWWGDKLLIGTWKRIFIARICVRFYNF